MTTKKISELPDASPLAGTEFIPVVQANATRKTTVDGIRSGLSATGHTHVLADITDAGQRRHPTPETLRPPHKALLLIRLCRMPRPLQRRRKARLLIRPHSPAI